MDTLQNAQRIIFEPLTLSAVSTDVRIEIQYFGSQNYADVEVAAGGDLTLSHGASVGTKVADTGVGVAGVFDLSTPATYTNYGLLVDAINGSANWRARLVGVRRADLTNNTLITQAAAQCNVTPVGLLGDTTIVVQTLTHILGLRVTAKTLTGPGSGGWISKVTSISAKGTTTVGATSAGYDDGEGVLIGLRIVVYSVNDLLKAQTRIFHSAAMVSATLLTVDEDDADSDVLGWGGQPLCSNPGEDLLVLLQNSGTGAVTITSPTLIVKGYREQIGGVTRTERWHQSSM